MFLKIVFLTAIVATFCNFASAASVTCTFNGNQCTSVNSITPVTSANEAISVNGQSATYIDPTLNSIGFPNPVILNYIPTNIFQIFSNIQSFSLGDVQLTTLVTDSFNYCSKLTSISIGANKNLTNIPAGFARSCSIVEALYINQNGIQTIDVNAFQGLINLKQLNLMENKIVTIPVDLFKNTPGLWYLVLNSNMIQSIDANLFKGLVNISMISMSYNQIFCLPALDFMSTSPSNILSIDLSENPLNAIDPTFFPNLFTYRNKTPTTTSISIPGSKCLQPNSAYSMAGITGENWPGINQTLTQCFANYNPGCSLFPASTTTIAPTTTSTSMSTTLSSIFLPNTCSSNKICRYYADNNDRYTCVIDGVDSILTSIGGTHLTPFTDASVTRVYFTNSFLTKVPPILFSKFPNLNFLSIANCSLSVITDQTFNQCGSLTYLDARFNGIYRVSETAFRNCTSLQTIDFTGNPIEFIDAKIYTLNPNFKRIILNTP